MPGFGQNGSIAWVVVGKPNSVHLQSPHGAGWRGKISDPEDRPVQNFLVRLRFANLAAAEAAWRDKTPTEVNGQFVVILRVPAQEQNQRRTHLALNADNEPTENPPWEIFIDWEFGQAQA